MNQEKEDELKPAPEEAATTASPERLLTADDVEHLQQTLQAAEEEIESLKDQHLRAKAEMENVRRRAATDLSNAHKYAVERFAVEVLTVKDSLELAQAIDIQSENAEVVAKMHEGLDLTLKQLDTIFEKFALVTVEPKGEKFDPEQHQAMTMVESQDVEPNHIVEVVQKGYLLNGRVLRPAMVIVAKAPANEAAAKNGAEQSTEE
jgi:molecular chaperone GrpE